jgi:tRNA nucleotidyltransferase (CCA-adding enzyme)
LFFYFAAWLAPFDRAIREVVASRLRVRKSTLENLLELDDLRAGLASLPADARPSQVVLILEPLAPRTLLTARMLGMGPLLDQWLERYVTEWRYVKTGITGDDLRRAGLPPGPVYTQILDKILVARLDGQVTNEQEERALFKSLVASVNL